MGNCLKLRRRDESSDDGWENCSFVTPKENHVPEKQSLLDDNNRDFFSSSSSSSSTTTTSSNGREIKIKITKKQLEKLLGEVDVHEMSVDQVLSRLINHHYQHSDDIQQDQRSWRPRLQSIPEIN
ncbi:hypothetical protein ACH5RR_014839 [Cinchona calisaya]|uniref:Uncharacterized protein n=1 Tax=Cinchona calisaya TaxID=153742 RepID=A0ABD2ZRG0_9GENT